MSNEYLGGHVDLRAYRISSIDMLRGLVLVIMAIDHTRDFFILGSLGLPMSQPNIGLGVYITRWITHFCAPVFVFLAGTSVGLMSGRKSNSEISTFLIKRGLWLIVIEVIVISNALSFRPMGEPMMGGLTIVFLQVIWVMGISMIILAGALHLGGRACLIIGAIIVCAHNLLVPIWPQGSMTSGADPFWITFYSQGSQAIRPFYVMTLYPLFPWIGVMLLGFGSAFIFRKSPPEREAQLLKIGSILTAAFFVLRAFDIYGDPNPWQLHEEGVLATIFDFMNVTKYPPSLLFLLITIGPMAVLCSYADRWSGWLKDTLVMFGRAPFAFYIAHFFLIHISSVIFGVYQGFEVDQMAHFFFLYPQGYGTNLLGVYIAWLLVITVLYPFCKWVAGVKARRKDWWLSYL